MTNIDFMSSLHKKQSRDYLARVNDKDYPKAKAAKLAKEFSVDYWDGDRRINYGGYKYIPGRWGSVAKNMIEHYNLREDARILDVGCGKGFLLYDFLEFLPKAKLSGIDISQYAIDNAKSEVAANLIVGNATSLPWADSYFDLVVSINTFHNLHNFDLEQALREFERVGRNNKYLCVESYRSEEEKANLLYWQVTCEAFCTPEEWYWWFDRTNYTGDHSFIFFE